MALITGDVLVLGDLHLSLVRLPKAQAGGVCGLVTVPLEGNANQLQYSYELEIRSHDTVRVYIIHKHRILTVVEIVSPTIITSADRAQKRIPQDGVDIIDNDGMIRAVDCEAIHGRRRTRAIPDGNSLRREGDDAGAWLGWRGRIGIVIVRDVDE